MAGIEIREGSYNGEELIELWNRVWMPEYGGKAWLLLPHVELLRWQLGASKGRCIAAYHGTKLVGSNISIPYSLRIGSTVSPIALIGGLTVDPAYRRVALPLIERLHCVHEEQGVDFALGSIASDQTSSSYQFWSKYSQTFPTNFRFLFSTGYWVKILSPHILASIGIKAWERLTTNALGPLLRAIPYRHAPHLRPYRMGDLERCTRMLDKSSADFDWALVWSAQQLANELENPACETLVLERGGSIQAIVRYKLLSLLGRQLARAALIDLWADDDVTGAIRVGLLGRLCDHLRERDVHLVLAPRCAMMPSAAFVANLFLPPLQEMRVVALLVRRELALTPPKTWRLVLM